MTGFESTKRTIAGRAQESAMAPTSTTEFPILQHLNATKKFLQDVTIDARCVRSCEIRRVGLNFKFSAFRPPWIRPRYNERMD
jgi:hypothetical protein